MEKPIVIEVSHNGRRVQFVIPVEIEREVRRNGVGIAGWFSNTQLWFDIILSELMGSISSDDSKESCGKDFTIVIYGFVDRWINKHPEGLDVATDYDDREALGMGRLEVGRKFFKYKILSAQSALEIDPSENEHVPTQSA